MSAHLVFKLTCGGLEAGHSYGASLKWEDTTGHSTAVGISDQEADETGHVSFPLLPIGLQTVGAQPGTLTAWVRDGGTDQDSPPVTPTATVSVAVA